MSTTSRLAIGSRRPKSTAWLRIIAIFKFCKAIALILLYLGALALLRPRITMMVQDWSEGLPREGEQQIVYRLLDGIWSLNHKRLVLIGITTAVVATLFVVEGTGLWLRKSWAEWMTVILTSLLIPFEIYELVHRVTPTKGIALVLNILVVAYLVFVIRSQRGAHRVGDAAMASLVEPVHPEHPR